MADSSNEMEDLESMSNETPNCKGLPQRLWNTKCITLYNEERKLVGKGTCHSVNLDLVLDTNGHLGDSQVAVHICRIDSENDISKDNVYALVVWPTKLVHCHGVSLHDHEARDNFNRMQAALTNMPLSKSKNAVFECLLKSPSRRSSKIQRTPQQRVHQLGIQQSVLFEELRATVSREKIKLFRERMYDRSTFKFRAHMKTDVHKSVHRDACGRRMVTVEWINVCMRAWMHISEVLEATFYRYQKQARANMEAREHGNMGLAKTRKHTEQTTTTLKCILEREVDHMPHHTHTTKFGEKVVSMILPATFQWKDRISKINEANALFGLREVSSSKMSKMRRSRFP